MTNIRMPHEEVRAVGGVVKQVSEASKAAFSSLSNGVGQLVWEGVTHNAYMEFWQQAQTTMKAYHTELDQINEELTQIADRFKAADEAKF